MARHSETADVRITLAVMYDGKMLRPGDEATVPVKDAEDMIRRGRAVSLTAASKTAGRTAKKGGKAGDKTSDAGVGSE